MATKIINIKPPVKETRKFYTHETLRGVDPELWKLVQHEKIEHGGTLGEVFNRILRAYYQGKLK